MNRIYVDFFRTKVTYAASLVFLSHKRFHDFICKCFSNYFLPVINKIIDMNIFPYCYSVVYILIS